MSIAESSPISLASSFALLAEETANRRTKRQIRKVSHQLAAGVSLSEVLDHSAHDVALPLRELIQVSSNGNVSLHQALVQYTEYTRKFAASRRRLTMVLFYPALLLLAAFLYINFFAHFVSPTLEETYHSLGAFGNASSIWDYPFPINLMRLVRLLWLPLLLILPLLVIALFAFQYVTRKLAPFRHILNHIPFFGKIYWYPPLALFCRYLSLLVGRNVPLPEAIRAAGGQSSDPTLRTNSRLLAELIETGKAPQVAVETLRETMQAFPREIAQAFQWSDSPESLSQSLAATGDILESYALTQINVIPWIVIPWVIGLLMGTVLGIQGAFFRLVMTTLGEFS